MDAQVTAQCCQRSRLHWVEYRPYATGISGSCVGYSTTQGFETKWHSHNALPVQVQHGSSDVMAQCHCHGRVHKAAARQVRQQLPI